jgi:hypothetical protein
MAQGAFKEAGADGSDKKTARRIGLATLILAADILSARLPRGMTGPLIAVTDELKHVERFELDQVRRRSSRSGSSRRDAARRRS